MTKGGLMMSEKYFSKAEAEGKVGTRIRTLREFSSVPRLTTGSVVEADYMGKSKPPFGEAFDVYDVVIEWDLPRHAPRMAQLEVEGEPVLFVQPNRPLRDNFTKEEYYQFLEEL